MTTAILMSKGNAYDKLFAKPKVKKRKPKRAIRYYFIPTKTIVVEDIKDI